MLLADVETSNANLQIGESLTHRIKQSVDLLRILLVHLQRCLLMFCKIHFCFLELLPHIGSVLLVTHCLHDYHLHREEAILGEP